MGDVMNREGIVYGMPEATYHGGAGELSSTGAKLILESPAKFKHQIIDGHRVHRDAYDLGTAVHTKVLGTGAAAVTCPPEYLDKTGGMRTGEAKAWKAEQQAAGNPVVTVGELDAINLMAESVLAHPTARRLFERPGKPEVSIFDDRGGVRRRGRFDYLPDEGGITVDLKTAVDASPNGFASAAAKFRYHVQRGHYLDILERLGRAADMLFVVVEKSAPYLTAVHRLNQQFAEMGEAEALEAVDIYRRCTDTGIWPGYSDEATEIQPPVWSIYDYQDRYESGEITL